MKTVIVRPERCVGCLQCRLNCAVEHSRSKSLYGAIGEAVRPKPRLRIFPAGLHLAFPNKCRHCRPAPCLEVCIAGAIRYDEARGAVDIDFQRCISCAMCAMACPFGVLTYGPVYSAPDWGRGGPEVRPVPRPERQAGSRPASRPVRWGPHLRRVAGGAGGQRRRPGPGLLRRRPRGAPGHPGAPRPASASGGNWANLVAQASSLCSWTVRRAHPAYMAGGTPALRFFPEFQAGIGNQSPGRPSGSPLQNHPLPDGFSENRKLKTENLSLCLLPRWPSTASANISPRSSCATS